jgi:hypothetical protein
MPRPVNAIEKIVNTIHKIKDNPSRRVRKVPGFTQKRTLEIAAINEMNQREAADGPKVIFRLHFPLP